MQSIQLGGCSFLFRYFLTLFCLIPLWCLSFQAQLTVALLLMDGQTIWPLLCLAKELFLFRQRPQLLMTRLFPQLINLYAFVSIYLSSSYLMSSGTAHDPIPIYGPFIPTKIIAFWVARLLLIMFISFLLYVCVCFKFLQYLFFN